MAARRLKKPRTGGGPQPRSPKAKAVKIGLIVLAIIVALGLIAGLVSLLFGGDDKESLGASDVAVATKGDVSQELRVSGNVAAARTESLGSSLGGPVKNIRVKVGQRVRSGELLATIDVTDLRRERDDQLAHSADSVVGAQTAVEQARQALADKQALARRGLDPTITSAESAARKADRAYEEAQRDYEQKLADKKTGMADSLRQQDQALEQARSQVLSATIGALRAGVGSATSVARSIDRTGDIIDKQRQLARLEAARAAASGEKTQELNAKIKVVEKEIDALTDQTPGGIDEQQLGAHLGTAEALNGLNSASRALKEQQKAHEHALTEIDRDLAKAQSGVADAFDAKQDAVMALEAARLQSQQELHKAQDAVAQAQRSLDSATNQARSSVEKITSDLSGNEVRAPFPGIVTAVGKEGAKNVGSIVTVADDSTLVVTSSVRESEVGKLHLGDTVELTTMATKDKKYAGKVTFISPVAASASSPQAEGSASEGGSSYGGMSNTKTAPLFPIEITIKGDTQGLRIGGAARARILIKNVSGMLSVPRDAIGTEDDKSYVLVIPDNGAGAVVRRTVTTGDGNDFSVAVTSGLHEGDVVIRRVSDRVGLVGKKVALTPGALGDDQPRKA